MAWEYPHIDNRKDKDKPKEQVYKSTEETLKVAKEELRKDKAHAPRKDKSA